MDSDELTECHDLIDAISRTVGWGDNPDPEDCDEAVLTVQKLLTDWTNK